MQRSSVYWTLGVMIFVNVIVTRANGHSADSLARSFLVDESPVNFDCFYGNLTDCQNGGYWSCKDDPNGRCYCPPGWTGTNCTMCESDDVCYDPNTPYICDHTFRIYSFKEIECDITDTAFLSYVDAPKFQYWCNYDTPYPFCQLIFWGQLTGSPPLMSCLLSDCITQPTAPVSLTSCAYTQCWCTLPDNVAICTPYVQNMVKTWVGKSDLKCNQTDSTCIFTQDQLLMVLPMQCTAAWCNLPPPAPPVQLSAGELAGILGGGTVGIIALLFVVAHLCMRKYNSHMLQPLEKWRSAKNASSATGLVAAPVDLGFRGLSYALPDGRKILYNVTGEATSGTMLAIMGPSGAGKTTLLDVLAGRKSQDGTLMGEITVNGDVLSKQEFVALSGYVLQDDTLLPTLTVQEAVIYAAQLRLPASMSFDAKLQRTSDVIHELGLTHVAQQRIGDAVTRGISGGERRRVSIACELVTGPSIIFLDEPTTGLDAYSALSVMRLLKELASKGRTIVFSIHQPRSNIFSLFDQLLVVAEGHVVYNGRADSAVKHFGSLGHVCPEDFNPADYFIDLVSSDSRDEDLIARLSAPFETQETPVLSVDVRDDGHVQTLKTVTKTKGSRKLQQVTVAISSFLHTFWILCMRTFINAVRNPFLLRSQYLLAITVGLFVGLVYYRQPLNFVGVQNRLGSLFFITSVLGFASLSSLEIFVSERVLFLRERESGYYGTGAYFLAKTLFEMLPMRAVPPLLLGSIVYWLVGFQADASRFFVFLATLLLLNIVTTAMCLTVATFVPSVGFGNLLTIMLMMLYMLFGGFLVSNASVPAYISWIKYLSFFNYSVEILAINELSGVVVLFDPLFFSPILLNGNLVLINFGFSADNMARDFWALGGWAAGYMLLAVILLNFVVREKR